jgi:thioesterase domain-containing protein
VEFVALLDTPPRVYTDPQAPEALLAALFVADAARAGDAGDRTMPDAETSTAEEQLSWLNDTLADGDPHMRVELDRRFALYKAHVGLVAGLTPTVSDTRTLVVGTAAATDGSAAWSWLLPNVVQSVQVPGDHYSFLQAPGVSSVAAALRRAT